MTTTGGELLRELSRRLAAGAVDAPDAEAATVLATVTGESRGALAFLDVADEPADRARRVAAERASTGAPLQYLLGTAVSGALDLAVGPGVFIPRPETELLVDWALRHLPTPRAGLEPVVVDLCAGSGTLALEIAHARPDARVHAIELDPAALGWLRRNVADRAAAGDRPVAVHAGDATDPEMLAPLHGLVDLVVSNPPYIPAGARLPHGVIGFEPALALFGGESGNDVIARLVPVCAALLRPGGAIACEHDDSTGDSVAALFAADGAFGRVKNHDDLAGRPRFVSAERLSVRSACEGREPGR